MPLTVFKVVLLFLFASATALPPDNCSEVAVVWDNYTHTFTSLDSIVELTLPNNTEIWICSSEATLGTVIAVENASNISLRGLNQATVHCPDGVEAGFHFTNIQGLVISDITIENCGTNSTVDPDLRLNLAASVNIQFSSSVSISNLTVLNGPGTGLALFDIDEYLEITDSVFEGNGHDMTSGGNGLYLEVMMDSGVKTSPLFYNIQRCMFINNTADTTKDSQISGFTRYDKGGGICALIRAHDGVKLTIENSTITGNMAREYGGGIFAAYHNNASNSKITVRGSNYSGNSAVYGGAHYSGYLHSRSRQQAPLNCSHLFVLNQFRENHAKYGGAVSVFSSKTTISNPDGNVTFDKCSWYKNSGHFGSAIAIMPNAWNLSIGGYLPMIYFKDCTLDSNRITDDLDNENTLIRQYTKGAGALFCTDHTLEFNNYNSFLGNDGSAFYLGDCLANFSEHSKTVFMDNTGYQGGAIYQVASALHLFENTEIVFENNTAYDKGGAIYHTSYNFHMYDYSRTCFLSYRGNINNPASRNISLTFESNQAVSGYGHSIFVYSLLPCYRLFRFHKPSFTPDILKYVGNVTYYPSNRKREVATAASFANIRNQTQNNSIISLLPGETVTLPYTDTDDLGQEAKNVYLVTVETDEQSLTEVDEAYTYISSNKLLIYGSTEDRASLKLSSFQSRHQSIIFNISMLPCPPGFLLSRENEPSKSQCICAYGTDRAYYGIEHCHTDVWRANKRRAYWVGYMGNRTICNEDSLATGSCPLGFCSHNVSLLLPSIADGEILDKSICIHNRTDTLCGECKPGTSVYYHSLHYVCGSNSLCSVGWLFYILSELVPVTIIFLVIIVFNFTFTSGLVNGFIFFSQVVVMFHVSANNLIQLPLPVSTLNRILQMFYQTFNLNTLMLDEASFCLFENATALDVISFSYITLVYSLLLIIGTVLVMNQLSFRCCSNCCHCNISCLRHTRELVAPQLQTLESGIIHGLTAFFVLCYANCAQASILLLSYAVIRGKGASHVESVVFYNGNIIWFSTEHLPYAIPAIIMGLFFVVLPPIILLVYPLHYKVISILKLSESKCVGFIIRPLEKLKPLLDSFQGSFKDNFRFFSGLYFVYRFSILAAVSLSRIDEIYAILHAILIVMILLHAICQPYKKRLHNVIDSLLFIDLAVINTITIYNITNAQSEDRITTDVLGYIQAFLISLPLLVVTLCVLKKAVCGAKALWARRAKKQANSVDEEELPARMVYTMEELDSSLLVYSKMK